MCCGMTAIRMAMLQRFDAAVAAILLAAILDGMDGRLARLLGSTSRIGAELDSFSDLLSFGAAPAIVVYLKALNQWGEIGWAIVLFYTACVALRLARFNVQSRDERPAWQKDYFTGVPSPAGAYLALLPLMVEHAFGLALTDYTGLFALNLLTAGGLMVSRLPIFSMKNGRIPQRFVLLIMLLVVLCVGLLYAYPWMCLSLCGVTYLILIPLSWRKFKRQAQLQTTEK
jgi:CDP-diacylglycerol--serine O-phosphatidyltransferase